MVAIVGAACHPERRCGFARESTLSRGTLCLLVIQNPPLAGESLP